MRHLPLPAYAAVILHTVPGPASHARIGQGSVASPCPYRNLLAFDETIISAFSAKDECVKIEKPGVAPHPNGTTPDYVSHILDIFDKNKKPERRPHGNEVRISQFWRRQAGSNRRQLAPSAGLTVGSVGRGQRFTPKCKKKQPSFRMTAFLKEYPLVFTEKAHKVVRFFDACAVQCALFVRCILDRKRSGIAPAP